MSAPVFEIEIDEAENPFEGIAFETRSLADNYLLGHLCAKGCGPGSPQDFLGAGLARVIEIDVVSE